MSTEPLADQILKMKAERDSKALKEVATELAIALENLVEKCLHSDGYNQKIDELYHAQQALKKAKPLIK